MRALVAAAASASAAPIWRLVLRPVVRAENPFAAATEKTAQTFSVAFTAKCAECGVRQRATACNLLRLFFFLLLYPSRRSRPLHSFSSRRLTVSSRNKVRRGRDERAGSGSLRRALQLDLLLKSGGISFSSRAVCRVYLFAANSGWRAGGDSGDMGRCSGEVSIGEQLTRRGGGVHANSRHSRP